MADVGETRYGVVLIGSRSLLGPDSLTAWCLIASASEAARIMFTIDFPRTGPFPPA